MDHLTEEQQTMERNRSAAFSKRIALTVIVGDILLSLATLSLCLLSILKAYMGGMPYLVALIGVYNAATGYVLGKFMDKSKAENTAGGIVYDTVMHGIKRDA